VIPATFGLAAIDGPVRDLRSLRSNVDQANRLYQAAHYEQASLLCSRLIGEARATADRLGQDRNDFWTAFGPTDVALHEVSTAVELGDAGEVVRKGEQLDPARFPAGLLGRRAQVYIDLARGYTQQRKDAAAVNMLLEAERFAPEAVRYQGSSRRCCASC